MKRRFFAALLAIALCAGVAAADVKVDAKNFPDEKFRQWVKENSAGGKDVLTDAQISAVKEIDFIFHGVCGLTDLKGIEHFTALTELRCDNNELTKLDVSKNRALETLRCSGGKIETLILPRGKSLHNIDCSMNRLTALDLSGVPALETLWCNINNITALDLSKVPVLKSLNCSTNSITALDLSGVPALDELQCSENKLTELDLSKIPALRVLDCDCNGLTELDLSGVPALTMLACAENSLTKLDLSGLSALENFVCSKNQLTKLELVKNRKLERLVCHDNKLTKLDLSRNTALSELYCSGNPIKELDLSKNAELRELTMPEASTVILPNRDKIDAKDFIVRKTSGGKYRLDLSRYGGKIENVYAYNKGVVNDTEVPVDVSGGVYTFDPCDGTISVIYGLGGEDRWMRLYVSEDSSAVPPSDESGSGKSGTPDNGDKDDGDGWKELDDDEEDDEDGEKESGEKPNDNPSDSDAPDEDGDKPNENTGEKPGGPDVGEDDEEEEVAEEHINLSVKLVNNTDAKIFVALAGQSDESSAVFSKGWYAVEPNNERTVGLGELSSGFSYGFYATSKGGKRVWAAKADDPKCVGTFWIHPKDAFESHDGTPIDGGKQVNFKRLNVSDEGKATIKFAVK